MEEHCSQIHLVHILKRPLMKYNHIGNEYIIDQICVSLLKTPR